MALVRTGNDDGSNTMSAKHDSIAISFCQSFQFKHQKLQVEIFLMVPWENIQIMFIYK